MNEAFISWLERSGSGGWAVILIGAGTIVAALISLFSAWSVALFTAWSNRRIEIERALREHRKTIVGPVVDYVDKTAAEAERCRTRLLVAGDWDWDAMAEETQKWMKMFDEAAHNVGSFSVDQTVAPAFRLHNEAASLLADAITELHRRPGTEYVSVLFPYLDLFSEASAAVADSADAYVFKTHELRRAAKRSLRDVRLKADRLKNSSTV